MNRFLDVRSWGLILLKIPGLVNTLFLIMEKIKYICNDLTNFSGVCVCVCVCVNQKLIIPYSENNFIICINEQHL